MRGTDDHFAKPSSARSKSNLVCARFYVNFTECLANVVMNVNFLNCISYSYWANLKLWVKHKISKEEFDIEARRLLAQDNG